MFITILFMIFAGSYQSTQSYHHVEKIQKNGDQVQAQQSTREKSEENINGTRTVHDTLNQAAGRGSLDERGELKDAITRGREAVGLGIKRKRGPEESILNVTTTKNWPAQISGIPFSPKEEPSMKSRRVVCANGQCSAL